MKKRSAWVVDQELATQMIYQDQPSEKLFEKLYPEEGASKGATVIKTLEKEIKEFQSKNSLRGEEWKIVNTEYSESPYIVSSLGRMLTAYRGTVDYRMVRITVEKGILANTDTTTSVPLLDIMDEAGFHYNEDEIYKVYKQTDYPVLKWPVTVLNTLE